MDFRPVLYVIGLLMTILSAGMILPMLADLQLGLPDWKVFLSCIVITSFFGGSLVLSNTGHRVDNINIQQAFLLIALSWLATTLVGALPFYLSELEMSFTDAFFESMSGITTTGATVISGLDQAPRGILLWRAILQWLGGIGAILMAMSVLPFLKIGGMQLFRTEISESEKLLPRTIQIAGSVGLLYTVLTIACATLYDLFGMGTFNAVVHAMTTVSTGGFSTFDASLGHYDSAWIEAIAIIFMLAGSLPFMLWLQTFRGNSAALPGDSQVRFFFGLIALAVVAVTLHLVIQSDMGLISALRHAAFSVVSLITGTGFFNGDYGAWGNFAVSILLFLMVAGACAGSTSGGIKIFRFQVLISVVTVQIRRLLYPSGTFLAHYNRKPVPSDVPISVMGFFFLYALCFIAVALGLSLSRLDFMTAFSGAAASISNVGPGFGDMIGPGGNYALLPDGAKWVCAAGMLVGRLEIFPLLVIFSSHFWRR